MKRGGQLKRTAMPRRSTPLQPGEKGLTPGGPLRRRKRLEPGDKPLARKTELPKVNKARQARKTAAAGMSKGDAQDIVRARSGGWCELRITGVCLGRATNFAHIKPEGQGGLYRPSVLLHLCGMGNVSGCHGYQENHRVEARKKGWLRRSEDKTNRPLWMWYRGEWGRWLLDDAGTAVPATNSGGKTPTTAPERAA